MGLKNPNFDPAVETSWNQCHFEDYQIINPKTIHRSKLELKRLRYHENRNNTSIDALLTFESHNFWSNRWIFKFHTFSRIGSQDLYRGVKINLIHDLLKVVALQRPPPQKAWRVYKRPSAPSRRERERERLPSYLLFAWTNSKLFSSLPNTKNTSKPLDSSLHQKYKVVFIPSIFLSFIPYLGFEF